MDGHHDFDHQAGRYGGQTKAMRVAIDCLGGKRSWTGTVRGLFGLIDRKFTIKSEGVFENDSLQFTETLSFEDGETQDRAWALHETPDGLGVEGENVKLIAPGKTTEDGFEIFYKIKFGSMWFDYRDIFAPEDNGRVVNEGFVKLLGVTVMKINSEGAPA